MSPKIDQISRSRGWKLSEFVYLRVSKETPLFEVKWAVTAVNDSFVIYNTRFNGNSQGRAKQLGRTFTKSDKMVMVGYEMGTH